MGESDGKGGDDPDRDEDARSPASPTSTEPPATDEGDARVPTSDPPVSGSRPSVPHDSVPPGSVPPDASAGDPVPPDASAADPVPPASGPRASAPPASGPRPSTKPSAADRGSTGRLAGKDIDGRYRVERVVAKGSMGEVYQARHVALKKRVALKVLHPDVDNHPELFMRFEREALAGAQMSHPNVTSATDFGTLSDGTRYLVMDFVRGETLRDVIDRDAPLPEARALDLLRQIALGLAHIHRRGIVHRDLKPRNVIVDEDGIARIVDFGLSKIDGVARPSEVSTDDAEPDDDRLTTRGEIFGTVEYLAPEAAFGMELVDARADLYALGVVAYEMLSGKHPFDARTEAELFAKQRHTPAPAFAERAPSVVVANDVEAIVRRLLEKDFDERYQSADDVVAALDAIRPPVRVGLSSRPPPRPIVASEPPASPPRTVSDAPPETASADPVLAPSRRRGRRRLSIAPPGATLRQAAAWAAIGVAALGGLYFIAFRDPAPDVAPVSTASPPVASVPSPPVPTESAPRPEPVPPPTATGSARTVDPATRRTEVARLVESIERSAWDDVASRIFDLFRADPDVLDDDAAAKAISRSVLALTKERHARADAVSLRVGTAKGGADLLLRIVEQQGKSMAADRARVLLRFADVRKTAPPATLVTFDLRDRPCNEKLALLDRAAEVGDARTILALDVVVRGCLKKGKSVDQAIAAIRARLDAAGERR